MSEKIFGQMPKFYITLETAGNGILKCFKFIRTFPHSLLLFFPSKDPFKALCSPIDEGQLGIWKFTISEVLNLDSAVLKSSLS